MTVWAHHMFATGAVLLPFFSFLSFLIAMPDRREVLQLDRHHVARAADVRDADAVRDRLPRHVPARRHHRRHAGQPAHRLPRQRHVLRRGPLPLRALRHRGVRLLRGRLLLVPEVHRPDAGRPARQGALLALFVGFHLTFLVQHWLGAEGMPRRYGDYYATDGFTTLNTISSIGAFVLGASTLPFIYNVIVSFRRGQKAVGDDPWGFGNSLEWATSCPPPAAQLRHRCRASARSGRPSTCTTRRPPARSTSTPPPS